MSAPKGRRDRKLILFVKIGKATKGCIDSVATCSKVLVTGGNLLGADGEKELTVKDLS